MFTNNQNKNLKYLVKYHSPDASGFYSRISSKAHTTFVYKDIESARLSAILQQVKANAKGYPSDKYYFTVEILNGRNVQSPFSTRGNQRVVTSTPISPDRYTISKLSSDYEDPSEGRERSLSLMRAWDMMEVCGMDFRYITQASLKSYAMANKTQTIKEGFFLFVQQNDRHCIGPFESPEAMMLSVEKLMLRGCKNTHSEPSMSISNC